MEWHAYLRDRLEAPRDRCYVPIDPVGTDFQMSVWKALQHVPAGDTTTYTELAYMIGRCASAARAVASACAANPIAILIPCHRVRRADGGLAGYRWGLERKRNLLAREGVLTPSLF